MMYFYALVTFDLKGQNDGRWEEFNNILELFGFEQLGTSTTWVYSEKRIDYLSFRTYVMGSLYAAKFGSRSTSVEYSMMISRNRPVYDVL